MRISVCNNYPSSNPAFGRLLQSPEEVSDYTAVLKAAKERVGQTGKSIFIVHDACLPQADAVNTGVGNLTSGDSSRFFDFIKTYLGINTVEVLPQGQFRTKNNGYYSPYSASALGLGNHQINLELLTQNQFSKLLTEDEFRQVVSSNNIPKAAVGNFETANFENIVEKGSAAESALRKAFARFRSLGQDTKLKREFTQFVSDNNDWLEPKGIYSVLSDKHGSNWFGHWPGLDQNLFNPDFDAATRATAIRSILQESADEIEFSKFKHFLAEQHLQLGRKSLDKKGLKLIGDCLVGFSADEVWANPKAFKQGHTIGWGLPALDFDTILQEGSASRKLLEKKMGLFAKRYDSIRFDVGWSYIHPTIKSPTGQETKGKYFGSAILEIIEKAVKRVKGENFDLKDLIYEFEAGDSDFPLHSSWGGLREPVENRVKVYGSNHLSSGWGSNRAFLDRGWNADTFVIGVGNHDPQPLRQIAKGLEDTISHTKPKNEQLRALAKILHIDPQVLENPVEFAKAKFAEPMMARNNQVFYMDVFGREERFNAHSSAVPASFRYKIPADFERQYMASLQEGYGFNVMDALEKALKAKGCKETDQLYQDVVRFRDILLENEPVSSLNPTFRGAQGLGGEQMQEILDNPVVKKNKYLKFIVGGIMFAAAGIGIAAFLINKKKNTSLAQSQMSPANSPVMTPTVYSAPQPAISPPVFAPNLLLKNSNGETPDVFKSFIRE